MDKEQKEILDLVQYEHCHDYRFIRRLNNLCFSLIKEMDEDQKRYCALYGINYKY